MKYYIEVTYLPTGVKYRTPSAEVTNEEFEESKEYVISNINKLTYFDVDGAVFPGDVLRSSCVISFIKE